MTYANTPFRRRLLEGADKRSNSGLRGYAAARLRGWPNSSSVRARANGGTAIISQAPAGRRTSGIARGASPARYRTNAGNNARGCAAYDLHCDS